MKAETWVAIYAAIPFELARAKSWTGVIRKRQDRIADLYTRTFYAAVYASHRNKAYLRLIPKAKPEPH